METSELVINPELRDLLPPLSPRQFAKLESEIIKDGCTAPLIVWGNVIVDGHHRHVICTKHNIKFQKVEKTFESMDDAKLWMWQNQNSRRNLSRFQRAETALKMKEIVASQAKERQIRKPNSFEAMFSGDELLFGRYGNRVEQPDLANRIGEFRDFCTVDGPP